ncbi:hypothetical protein C8R43DRAFT_1060675 [Mycena crocata]|nr:hypothetical protein C8R43DRAFT_1060675 [Mycena crocata]
MGLESAAGQCSFAYSKTYRPHEAPNPRLFIEGPGKLESPSTEADALALISACAPQRDGSGIVNSGVWEIAASKVRFLNPAWQSWIRDVAGATVLDGLRASCVDNSVDYIFNKLLIHDANSQLQCEATVIAKDQMGSLVVLLPSRFTGGTLGLRHDGQVKHMDLSGQSDVATSIVASYAGVEQTMSQVTSGYRLSLVYDITHRGPRPPTLEDLDSPKQRLRRIMRVWKEDLNAPRVLACLLRNKYFPGVTFDATALTGSDAVLLSTLHSLSREMQFSVYLAHIEVSVSMNTAADSSGACDYSADWSEESFADVEVEDLTITQILDLDGIPVEVQGLPRLSTSDLVNGPDAILHQSESVLQEVEQFYPALDVY